MHSKLSYLAPLVLLLSSRSQAQDLSSLPSCAVRHLVLTHHSLSPPDLPTARPARLTTLPKASLHGEDQANTMLRSAPAKSRPVRYRLDRLPSQRLRMPLQRQLLHQRSPSRSRGTMLTS